MSRALYHPLALVHTERVRELRMNHPIIGVGAPQNSVPNKAGETDTAGARRMAAVRRGDVPVRPSSSGQGEGVPVVIGTTVAPIPAPEPITQVRTEEEGGKGGELPPSARQVRRATTPLDRVPTPRLKPSPAIEVPARARAPAAAEATR